MDPDDPADRTEPSDTWLPPVVASPRPVEPMGGVGEPGPAMERGAAADRGAATDRGAAAERGGPIRPGVVAAPSEPRWPLYLMLGSFVVLLASVAFWWSSRSSEPEAVPTTVPSGIVTAPPGGAVVPTPTATSAASGYAFLATAPDGSPYRWNPCAPITYVVNPAGGPSGALADAQEAARRVSAATGIELRFGGTTAETPEQRRSAGYVVPGTQGSAWAPVLIAWASADRFQALGFDPRASGEGGPYPGPTDVVQTGQYVSGMIVLNAGVSPPPADGFATPNGWGIVLMHELGHVVGLDHVDDPAEIMSAGLSAPRTVIDWGQGDRAGLGLLGRQAGCLPVVTPPPA